MMPGLERSAWYGAFWLLLVAILPCIVAERYFRQRKHLLSGVPENHNVYEKDGEIFHVNHYPGNTDRTRYPITLDQHEVWKRYERLGFAAWGFVGLCLISSFAIARLVLRKPVENS